MKQNENIQNTSIHRPHLIYSTHSWGYEVIRGIDDNDSDRVIEALRSWSGKKLNVQVGEEYGGYRWTARLHEYYGDTVVHLAIKFGRPRIFRKILLLGPDLALMNGKGESAAQLAEQTYKKSIRRLILEAWQEHERESMAAEEAYERKRIADELEYQRRLKEARRKALQDLNCTGYEEEAVWLAAHGRVLVSPHLHAQSDTKSLPSTGQRNHNAAPPNPNQRPWESLPEDSGLRRVLETMYSGTEVLKLSTSQQLKYEALPLSSVALLAEAMRVHDCVRSLTLANKRLTSKIIEPLSEVLKFCTQLQSLDLRGNCIDDNGAAKLADVIQHHPSLHTVRLRTLRTAMGGPDNNLENYNYSAISRMMRSLSERTKVCLSANRIGMTGVSMIAESARKSSSLRWLSLQNNNLVPNENDCWTKQKEAERAEEIEKLQLSFGTSMNEGKPVGQTIKLFL